MRPRCAGDEIGDEYVLQNRYLIVRYSYVWKREKGGRTTRIDI